MEVHDKMNWKELYKPFDELCYGQDLAEQNSSMVHKKRYEQRYSSHTPKTPRQTLT